MRERHIHAALDCIRQGNVNWLVKQIYKVVAIPVSQGLKHPLCGPIEGIITPTYRCNSDCIMCDIKRRGNRQTELALFEWHKVIDDMEALGVSGIGISGGEPLVSDHTIPLVKYITQKKIPVHISSNGFLIDAQKAEQLIAAGLGSIAISIDSADPVINDKLRGMKGSFAKAVEGIKTLNAVRSKMKNNNLRLTIAAVISKESIFTSLDIVDLAVKTGADTVSYLPIMTSGIAIDKENRINNLVFREKEYNYVDGFIKKLIILKKKTNLIDNSTGFLKSLKSYFRDEPFPATCFAGYAVCVVGAEGRVFPCFDFLERNISVGNVKEMSLKDMWFSEEYKNMRRLTARCRSCYLTCHQEFNLLYKFTGDLFSE